MHGHSHGGNDRDDHHHEHTSCKDENLGEIFSLYKFIDTTQLRCLNESVDGAIKRVFKPWDKRLDKTLFVESDSDHELLVTIPFTGSVKLKSFCVIGGTGGTSPSKVKLFINRDDIDFGNVLQMKPVQVLELAENVTGEIEWPVQVYSFSNAYSLTMYFCENWGAESTIIYYIGLKGHFENVKRQAVITNYELKPAAAKNNASLLI